MDHAVIGVVGASGGLGASTLAVALGHRAARVVGATACVDAHVRGGGLDVTACVEHLPGLRWSDLADVRGAVDGPGLLARLPAELTTRVLAGDGGREPGSATASAVLTALRQACAVTVVDLPREGELLAGLVGHCQGVLLLAGLSARQVADAGAMARFLIGGQAVWNGAGDEVAAGRWDDGVGAGPAGGAVGLVVRTSRRAGDMPEELAAHLGLGLAGVWPDDRRLTSDAERGHPPGARDGSLARLCDRLLAELVSGWANGVEQGAMAVAGGVR